MTLTTDHPPKVHRVSLRALVRLLALLLVPAVVIATPNVGQAAPLGDWSTAVFDEAVGGPIPGKIKCQVNARWVEGTGGGMSIQVGAGSGCYSPGYYNSWQPGEPYTLSFEGSGCTGIAFTSTWMTGANHDWNSNHMVVGMSMEVPAGSCFPSSVCVTGAGTDTTQLCGSINLGPQGPSPRVGCPAGTPVTVEVIQESPDYRYYKYRVHGAGALTGQWQLVPFGGANASVQLGPLEWAQASGGVIEKGWNFPEQYNTASAMTGLIMQRVDWQPWSQATVSQYSTVPTSYDVNAPDAERAAMSFKGITDPSACRFWFGPKIANFVGTDVDDPVGPVSGGGTVPDNPEPEPTVPEPVDESDGCDFQWTSPSTWAGGGICAAVGLLDKLLDFFWQFFDKLWSGLKGLFMPTDGYLDARVAGTKEKLNDTTPGKWLDAFTGLTPGGGASGCGGIQVAPPNPGGSGTMFDVQLGAACSGNMASIASLVRLAISAAVVVGGGLACIRALGSGLGWNPSVGRGESV